MIKYRVFDKRLNSYHGSSGITSLVENGIWSLKVEDNQVLELFTGLQDKNGKDIYVGDIVKIGISPERKFTVIFSYESGQYELKGRDFTLTFWNVDREDREVIGNINENKELLK